MRHLQQTVHGILRPGEQSGYVAECPDETSDDWGIWGSLKKRKLLRSSGVS